MKFFFSKIYILFNEIFFLKNIHIDTCTCISYTVNPTLYMLVSEVHYSPVSKNSSFVLYR